jgi:hypothetical protein
MTRQDIHSVVGDEGSALAGAANPSSRSGPRRREPVISVHRIAPSSAAASDGDSGDETALEGFEVLGAVAVRVMARFSLPRMSLTPARGEGEDRRQLPNNQWED